MKLLLVGNHTCGNRGDGAILRGLITELRRQEPSVQLDIKSRYPDSSSFLLGEKVTMDELFQHNNLKKSKFSILLNPLKRKVVPIWLHLLIKLNFRFLIPSYIKKQITKLDEYDAVIQVGGSFFVDLYGEIQFEYAMCSILANKPIFLVGHSVGPFERKRYRNVANTIFKKVTAIYLRENVSLELMKNSNICIDKVKKGCDTAWLVPANPQLREKERPSIAITVRNLHPFDKRLGIGQSEYELAFADLCNKLIAKGYTIIACSTCTGIDGYPKDDRLVAQRVKSLIDNQEAFEVIMDELNDTQLGHLLSQSVLTVGTRLHSAIISKNFGTVAIALNYEHKSKGIMEQLGLSKYSVDLGELLNGNLYDYCSEILSDLNNEEISMCNSVGKEKETAKAMISDLLTKIKESSPTC